MRLSTRIVNHLAGLTLAGGDHDGQQFTVLPWERRFVRGGFRRAGDSALTVGRGNGKSALVAGIAAAMVDPAGPLHGRRREVVCVAASFDQSRIIFEDVLAFLGDRYDLADRATWRKQDSANRATLEFRAGRTGCGPRWRCSTNRLSGSRGGRIAAIRTGLGKVPGSRLIALGTRPADETHWFARLLKSAGYAQVHAARPDDPPFWLRTTRRANPSLDHLPSLRDRIAQEIEDARNDPDALASFKALRLNLGLANIDRAVLLDADAWKRAAGLPEPEPTRGGYVLGVDLGTSAAMSVAAACHRSGWLDAVAVFPEQPDLRRRGLADGVGGLHRRMAERGELVIAGGHVSDVRRLLPEALVRWVKPAAVVCDRWRAAKLRQHLDANVRAALPPGPALDG